MFPPPTPQQLAELAQMARKLKQRDVVPIAVPSKARLRRRLSPERVATIVQRYQAGEHSTVLSKEYGVSKSSLISLLRSEGVALRRQPMSPAAKQEAIRLYEQGLTIRQVADRVGSSYGSTRKLIHDKSSKVIHSCTGRNSGAVS